ncbi:MAG TPA: hypothetical protein VF523_07325 [Burkholderiales bacterium]
MEWLSDILDGIRSHWQAIAYVLTSIAGFTAFSVHLLTLRKLHLENARLKKALSASDPLIKVATFEQVERFARVRTSDRNVHERRKLHAIEGSGLAGLCAIAAAALPNLIYILSATFVAVVAAVVLAMRAERENGRLLDTLRGELEIRESTAS